MSDLVHQQTTSTTGALHFDGEQLAKAVASKQQPVLVDFYAEWCGPCKMAAPVIDKLAQEFAGQITIAKLNVDEHNQAAAEHGVMSIPTVIVFHNGEEVDRQIGFPGEEGYRQMITRALGQAT